MRVCLICTEFFGWGAAGGFGFATRSLGRELARRGIDVSVVMPRPRGIEERETVIDGIRIFAFPRHRPDLSQQLFRACDADIHHSMQVSLASYFAARAMPRRRHVISFHAPRTNGDWLVEGRNRNHGVAQMILTYLYYENPLVHKAVARADALYCPARFLIDKVVRKYDLSRPPGFLPTPVAVPDTVAKASEPTVCFLGRFDKVKRPETFFELSKAFPDVRFVALGRSADPQRDAALKQQFSDVPNLHITGFADQFSSDAVSDWLSRSWILINTSAKEGLPNAFVEASAHRCAVLAPFDPDGWTTRFGYYAGSRDFAAGLRALLQDDAWRALGQRGYEHVAREFAADVAVDRHIEEYQALL